MPRIIYIGWILLVIGFMIFIAFQPIEVHTFGRTIIDDGYYYLGYAHNIAQGNGFTFDGLVETNGVQPLWAILLTGLAVFVSDKQALIYAMLVLSNLLGLASTGLMFLCLRYLFSKPLTCAGTTIFFLFIANPLIHQQGMELNINLFVILLAFYAILRLEDFSFRPMLLAGLAIGLMCFGRLDNLVITPMFALIGVYRLGLLQNLRDRDNQKRFLQSVILFALPSILLFGTYLGFNLAIFDRPLPVSGDVKSFIVHQEIGEGGRFAGDYLLATSQHSLVRWGAIVNDTFGLVLAQFWDTNSHSSHGVDNGVSCLIILYSS